MNNGHCPVDGFSVCQELEQYRNTGMEPDEIKDWASLGFGPVLAKCCHDELDKLCDMVGGLDRLRAMCSAERDGRCVAPPCKVGDICYEIDPGHIGAIKHTVTGTTVYSRQADGNRYMEDFANLLVIDTWAVAEDGCEWADQYTAGEWAEAPKTRAEAVAALKGGTK